MPAPGRTAQTPPERATPMHNIRTSVVSKKGRDGKRTSYQIEFRDTATTQRWRRSLGTKDAREAERKRAEIDRKITHGTFNPYEDRPSRGGVTLAEAYADFIRAKKREGLRPRTLDNYASICGRFVKTMHATAQPGSIQPEHVERFVSMDARDGGKLSPTSRTTYLRNLRVFFRWLKAEGLLQVVPEVKRSGRAAKAARTMPAFLSPDDYAQASTGHRSLRGAEGAAGHAGRPVDRRRRAGRCGHRDAAGRVVPLAVGRRVPERRDADGSEPAGRGNEVGPRTHGAPDRRRAHGASAAARCPHVGERRRARVAGRARRGDGPEPGEQAVQPVQDGSRAARRHPLPQLAAHVRVLVDERRGAASTSCHTRSGTPTSNRRRSTRTCTRTRRPTKRGRRWATCSTA